jgi:arginyl-tRNA synthetase
VIQEVGKDAARFFFVIRKPDSPFEFDLELAKKKSLENPVYYVQYGHTRAVNILRFAQKKGYFIIPSKEISSFTLGLEEEKNLILKLLFFPDELVSSCQRLEPHRLVQYLIELASQLHSYYNNHRVVTDDSIVTQSRLALIECVRGVLKRGLTLLGIEAPDKM